MFYLFYLVIVFASVWGFIPFTVGILAVVILFFAWIVYERDIVYIAPCIVSPFFIFFRAQNIDNFFGAIILDFFMICAFFYFLYSSSKKTYRFSPFIKSIPFLVLVAHLLFTCLNGVAYITSASTYLVFIRVYAVPLVYLITLILAVQQNERLVSKGLYYYFCSLSFVVTFAVAQYLDIFQIPTENWVNFGRYFTFEEVADISTGKGIVSQRVLFGFAGIRINLLLGGSLGTIAAIVFTLALIQLFFKNTTTNGNRTLMNIGAIICIIGSILTFSNSLLLALLVLFFWTLIRNKISLFLVGIVVVAVGLLLLQSELLFGISPLNYFSESILYAVDSLYQEKLLSAWLIGIGPNLNVSGFTIRPENYVTDIGIFKVMQESGIINMLFVIIFFIFTFRRIFFSLKMETSEQKIIYAIILSICLSSVHANSLIQAPFNVLFALAIAGSLSPLKIIRPNIIQSSLT